ncbi:hypothetical protein MICA_773 [Micavibrio aeruginosavorus ARL-13]|uniref:Uncharacterized protein n=1 Tax=Micavibrio aeruginosavorus (strain ARL-13) TaxID=856793 RepID=G2KQH1_MICAA|nr:hypothetical protein MICA_773 [Micavibrio aeruginosavorus ARL-13]
MDKDSGLRRNDENPTFVFIRGLRPRPHPNPLPKGEGAPPSPCFSFGK